MRALLLCAGLAAALPRRRPSTKLSLRGGSATPAPISLPTVAEAESAHAWTATDTVARFAAKPDAGLSEAEVTRRREVAGRNVLVQAAKRTQWQMLLDQFDDRLVQILVGVAVLSAVLGMLDAEDPTAWVDPVVISLILMSNAAVGVWQESSAGADSAWKMSFNLTWSRRWRPRDAISRRWRLHESPRSFATASVPHRRRAGRSGEAATSKMLRPAQQRLGRRGASG